MHMQHVGTSLEAAILSGSMPRGSIMLLMSRDVINATIQEYNPKMAPGNTDNA